MIGLKAVAQKCLFVFKTAPHKAVKEMKRRYGEAVEYGCILCKILHGVYTEPCIHHLTGGGMGMKSEDFIPL